MRFLREHDKEIVKKQIFLHDMRPLKHQWLPCASRFYDQVDSGKREIPKLFQSFPGTGLHPKHLQNEWVFSNILDV